MEVYNFTQNDPFERSAAIRIVVPKLLESQQLMKEIRDFEVAGNSFAVWYLGQNGFILKGARGPLIGIDLCLSNSCAATFADRSFRLDRQLPIFIEPEDLDVDVFLTTHSHDDHADQETIRRINKTRIAKFKGPYESFRLYRKFGVGESKCNELHPGETIELDGSVDVQGTLAFPTDATDLNHIGVLVRFANHLTFYNTGDTAFASGLAELLPKGVDVCAICVNGGFHNLSVMAASAILNAIRPRVALPCHYDMMINNVASPEMLRVALESAGSDVTFALMKYYQPWAYRRI